MTTHYLLVHVHAFHIVQVCVRVLVGDCRSLPKTTFSLSLIMCFVFLPFILTVAPSATSMMTAAKKMPKADTLAGDSLGEEENICIYLFCCHCICKSDKMLVYLAMEYIIHNYTHSTFTIIFCTTCILCRCYIKLEMYVGIICLAFFLTCIYFLWILYDILTYIHSYPFCCTVSVGRDQTVISSSDLWERKTGACAGRDSEVHCQGAFIEIYIAHVYIL